MGGVITCLEDCLPNVEPSQIGDGICDQWAYCEELGFDGGDCECPGDYGGLNGPECCDGMTAAPPSPAGFAAECHYNEWFCYGEYEVCGCGTAYFVFAEICGCGTDGETAESDCVSSCDDEEGTFAYCESGSASEWECPEGMVFRSTCTDAD